MVEVSRGRLQGGLREGDAYDQLGRLVTVIEEKISRTRIRPGQTMRWVVRRGEVTSMVCATISTSSPTTHSAAHEAMAAGTPSVAPGAGPMRRPG